MKQNITQKQWNELNGKQKERFDESGETYEPLPNIGQMIEFLGYNLIEIRKKPDYKWVLLIKENEEDIWKSVARKELCDALFEATKYKLKQL